MFTAIANRDLDKFIKELKLLTKTKGTGVMKKKSKKGKKACPKPKSGY